MFKRVPIICISLAGLCGGMQWGQAQQLVPRQPMSKSDHHSSLSKEDYLRGDLREKDVITRMTPRLSRELNALDLELGSPVFIRVFKESLELELWVQQGGSGSFKLFKSWPIAAVSGKLGPKLAEGDRQAPEGFYYVGKSQMKPDSRFHLAFNIGYPNAYDRAHNRDGSFIMVHGNRVSIGCFAMTDPAMEEIYTLCHAALEEGQPFFRVHVFPFRMEAGRLAVESGNPSFEFWSNLQQGYAWFENKRTPPDVSVSNKRYTFR
ncbi:MAG: L,D-transpeptidase family protein [Akkermansiaceae bacterium]